MKIKNLTWVLIMSAVCWSTASASLLSVDFNSPTPSPTETGFSGVSSSGPTTIGAYTVTVTGADGFFDRGNTSGVGDTYQSDPDDLYRDFAYINGSGPINIEITGLTALAPYNVTLYSWDRGPDSFNETETTHFGPQSGSNTTGTVGTVTWNSHNPSPDPWPTMLDQYATTIALTTTTGTLDISANATAPSGTDYLRVDGFSISVVPEPASLGVLLLGGTISLRRRRV